MVTTVLCFIPNPQVSTGLAVQIALWLWFTVLFANFAEALAEGRGKARADSLKAGSQGLNARRKNGQQFETVAASSQQPAPGRYRAGRGRRTDSR